MPLLFLNSSGWAYLAIFAQEVPAPDAAHLSAWLVDAAAVGAILLVFLKIIDHFKRKPSLEQETVRVQHGSLQLDGDHGDLRLAVGF
jgi:hypothetical protein